MRYVTFEESDTFKGGLHFMILSLQLRGLQRLPLSRCGAIFTTTSGFKQQLQEKKKSNASFAVLAQRQSGFIYKKSPI